MDRYTPSNIIHQAAKIDDEEKRINFIQYWNDYEYNKLELPIPDIVFFLDMPPKFSQLLSANRNNKITGDAKKDLHEKDLDFLAKSYNNAKHVSSILNWHPISCTNNEEVVSMSSIKTIEHISNEILDIVLEKINE